MAQDLPVHDRACNLSVKNARCGFIEVRENRADPNSRIIQLSFVTSGKPHSRLRLTSLLHIVMNAISTLFRVP